MKENETPSRIPTLADVAGLAGVSTATVSRSLNFPNRVSAKTRDRVLSAVQELGYAPNFGAQALAAKRTNTIGAIVPTLDNSIFARCLQAFQEHLLANGITTLVASTQYRPEIEYEQIRTLVARGADALLLIGYDRTDEAFHFLDRRGVPTVISWAFDPAVDRLVVGFDNRAAMKKLARKVIEYGHSRIGYITAQQAGNDRARDRVNGLKEAMAEGRLDPEALMLVETAYSIENGARAAKGLLERPDRPSAIMCATDVQAVGALRGALDLGFRVPDDVSITGFDNAELAQVADPPLTTVEVPDREMGRAAAEVLIKILTRDGTPQNRQLETKLCMRQSLGPPPALAAHRASSAGK